MLSIVLRTTATLLVIVFATSAVQAQSPTEFTYQGQLYAAGRPADGLFNLRLTPYDADLGGNPLAATTQHDDVEVERGQFSVATDFGDIFGMPVWVQIEVQRADDADWTALSPRQAIRPVPAATSADLIAGMGAPELIQESDDILGVETGFSASGAPGSTLNFVGPTRDINLDNDQIALVIVNKAFGSISAGGGRFLALDICYRTPDGSLVPITQADMDGLRVPSNTRTIQSLSGIVRDVIGEVTVGMCAVTSDFSSWNDNGHGSITVLQLKDN